MCCEELEEDRDELCACGHPNAWHTRNAFSPHQPCDTCECEAFFQWVSR